MSGPWIALQIVYLFVLLAIILFLSGIAKRVLVVLEEAESKLGNPIAPDPGGLEIGQSVPEFEAELADGGFLDRRDLVKSNKLLLFLSSGCPPCEQLANELHTASASIQSSVVVILSEDDAELSFPDGTIVLRETRRSLSAVFRNNATPRAYALDANGVVVERTIPQSVDDLAHAIRHAGEKRGGERRVLEKARTESA